LELKGGWIRQVIRAHTSPFSEICNNVIIFIEKKITIAWETKKIPFCPFSLGYCVIYPSSIYGF
jgi:hypothetical protein